jgi:hypothetical protein
MNSVRVVVHAPFGGRVNAPWGMALAHRCAMVAGSAAGGGGRRGYRSTTDDGVMLRLPSLRDWLPWHSSVT